MIETKGLCALFEATDAALKAANVTMTGYEAVGSGHVAAFFRGDVASLKAAIDAGADVRYVPALSDVPAALAGLAHDGDLILTLGAGDITTVGPALATLLEAGRG